VQIAAALGARTIAIDVDPVRLALVGEHGAERTFDSSATDFKALKQAVQATAAEWGCPSYGWKIFECSGHPGGQQTAFGLLTHAATLLVIGFTLAKTELRLSNVMAFDATIQGSWGCRPELYPQALALVTGGRITLKPFIERHALRDGPSVLERVARHELRQRAILEPEAV
jgi:6-hydroxycyclohex-1-ene-1-carbonyl-CoA dehydrogenase